MSRVVGLDGGGDEVEYVAAMLATGLDDREHCFDEAAGGAEIAALGIALTIDRVGRFVVGIVGGPVDLLRACWSQLRLGYIRARTAHG